MNDNDLPETLLDGDERAAKQIVERLIEGRRIGMSAASCLEEDEFEGIDMLDLTNALNVAIGQIVRLTR